MKRIPIVLLLVVISCSATALAQRRRVVDTKNSVRLEAGKPSVYLEFVRAGVCHPSTTTTIESWGPCMSERGDTTAESYEAVWLRVRNNSRWPINFDALSLYVGRMVDVYKTPEGKFVTAIKDATEIRARYRVEAEIVWETIDGPNGKETKLVDVKAPIVNRVITMASRVWLPPGRSAVFVVRREHLAKYLRVYLSYKYSWDGDQNDMVSPEPNHRVYFSWYALQKALGLVESEPG